MTDAEWDALWAGPTAADIKRAQRERQRADPDEQFRRYAAWVAVDPKGRTCGFRVGRLLMELEDRYGRRV